MKILIIVNILKGFHRYSVDKEWRVPHFEKMLYDQGQLIKTYANMYQINGRFSDIFEGIGNYLNKDLSHKVYIKHFF